MPSSADIDAAGEAVRAARPNPGHEALVDLERRTPRFTLITQNVDGLHERTGSRNVIRLHGSIWEVRCTSCRVSRSELAELTDLPPRCACGGMLRLGVVWFGESLPEGALQRAARAVREAEVLIVAGTSAQVYPAAGLIPLALEQGAQIVEINPDETDFSDDATWSLRGTSAHILPRFGCNITETPGTSAASIE
jgi:NAD-dependent deacetylase